MPTAETNLQKLKSRSNSLRRDILNLCHKKKASHIGGALSIIDILNYLYFEYLKVDTNAPKWPERDRLFYSKGHACTALYTVLAERGFFNKERLFQEFTENGTFFTSHVNHKIDGVELSTGSLGHALGVSAGVAYALKLRGKSQRIVTILSDGELDEGSNWEALLFAAHHKLSNLTVVIDYNKIQSFGTVSDVLALEPLTDKFEAFGFHTLSIDGHNFESIVTAFDNESADRPRAIIAHTVKGKGISFMENKLEWHYKSPSVDELTRALEEVSNAN